MAHGIRGGMGVDGRLELTGCTVDWLRGVVVPHDGGPDVPLTAQEQALLQALAAEAGPVGRDALVARVWGADSAVGPRVCDTLVSRLRAKIEVDASAPDHLLTVHGAGYRLRTPTPAPARGADDGDAAPAQAPGAGVLVLGAYRVDLDRYQVDGPNGRTSLTGNEAALLRCLAEANGAAVERDALTARVWGPVRHTARRLDNAVRRLRTKIEAEPDAPRYLVTAIRGGHRLVVPASDVPPRSLPAALARRFGPASEVDDVLAALTPEAWLTLVGPAGAGKSRLALAVGHALEAVGRPVAWVGPGESIPAAPVAPGGVLIVDAAERAVAHPGHAVLATCRAPLGFDGERVVDVRPLSPADAVALFIDRAVRPPLSAELPDVEALVAELGGLPAAIASAAARTAVRSVGEVRARLAAVRHNL